MKTKIFKLFILLVMLTVAFSLVTAAKTATPYTTAEELLAVSKTDHIYQQSLEQLKPLILQQLQQMGIPQEQTPTMEKYANKISELITTELSWDKLKDDYIQLLISIFTEQEMHDAINFFKSPSGQKIIEKMPLIMQQASLDEKKMQDELVKNYMSDCTKQELQELLAFYKSPSGQKMIEKLPQLKQRSTELSQKYIEELTPKIEQITREMINEISNGSK